MISSQEARSGKNMPDNCKKPKPRVGFVKSRTGCSVCKTRRIKCDETKPSCTRCTSSGRVCEGYLINRRPIPPKISHVLVPKPSSPESSTSAENLEQRCSQLYFDKTADKIGCWLGSSFWDRVVFKTAQREPAIRCLVLAIGALDTQKHAQIRGTKTFADDAHLYGLQHYEMAIKILREPAWACQAGIRTTLIASILILFFEANHGDHVSAVMQFYTGFEVFRDISSGKNLKDQINPSGFPASEHVDDEIFHAFRHLHLQLSFIYLFKKPIKAPLMTPEYLYSRLTIPASASESEEAQLNLEYIVGEALDFVASLDSYGNTAEQEVTSDLVDARHHFSMTPIEQFPPAVFSRQMELIAELRKWREAFQPFFEHTRTSAGKIFYSFASALESLYLAAYIATASTFFEKQTEFDDFMPHFRTIVQLCEDILQRPSHCDQPQMGEFSLDLHVICPLFLVGAKCRDPKLRRKAISLLGSTKTIIKGLWPVLLLEKVLLWIMNVEEDGIEGGCIKEEMRSWIYNIQMIGPGRSRAKVQVQVFVQGSPRISRAGSLIKEAVVEW